MDHIAELQAENATVEDETLYAARDHAYLAALSFVANIGCTIGKLFPGRYICETWQCNQMVHNAFMSLAAGIVDVCERYAYLRVLVPDTGERMCWIPLGGITRMLLKTAQLSVTLAWTLVDLQSALISSPGLGTLVLTSFSCLIQFQLVLMDLRAGYLTEKLNRQARYYDHDDDSGFVVPTRLWRQSALPRA